MCCHSNTTAWPLRCTTRKAKHSCSVVGCTDPSRFATSPPYQRAPPIGQAPPHPPTVTTRAGLAIGRTGQCPPPVGRRQGRAGHRGSGGSVGRFGRFPEPPAVILYLRPPPPPPPPPRIGSQSSPGHNTHPSKAHTHRRPTLTPLEHIRLHRSLLSGSHFSPKTQVLP